MGVTLLEREHELAAIDATLRDGGLLVLQGTAGTGKSALLAAASDRGRAAERRVLSARGALAERLYGFGVVRQLLDPLLRTAGATHAAVGPATADEHVLQKLTSRDGAPNDFVALRALTGLVVRAAEDRPLAIVLDDAQWADVPSLRFAGFLARRLDGPDIAMFVAIRAGEPAIPATLLDDLCEAPRARRRVPAPLSAEAIATVVRATEPAVTSEILDRIGVATGGNPLLVDEVARGLARGDDPLDAAAHDIAAGVRRRVERADAVALEVAQAAAILGADATLARLVAVLDLPDTDIARASSALATADVLMVGSPYEFVHPLVADAVIATVDAGRLLELRRRTVAALRREAVPVERLATHLTAMPGTGDARLVEDLRRAAAVAGARGAISTAAALLRRALDEPPPPEDRKTVLRELATAERLAADARSIEHARAALELAVDPEDRVDVGRELARCEFDLSRYSDAARTTIAAIREAPEDLAVGLRDALRVDLLTIAMLVSSVSVETLLADIGRGAPPQDPQVSTLAAMIATSMRLTTGEPVAAFMPDLEGLLRQCPPNPQRLDAQLMMWWATAMLEEFGMLERLLGAAEAAADGSVWTRRMFTTNLARATMLQRRGRLPEAIAVHRVTLEAIGDNAAGMQSVTAGLASCLVDHGDVAAAVALVDAMVVPSSDDEGPVALIHWERGRVLAAAGRTAEALHAFEQGWGIQRTFPDGVGVIWEAGGADRIACLARAGRRDEALTDAQAVIHTARPRGLTGLEGIGLRVLGELTGSLDHLTRAAEMLDSTELRLERSRAHLAVGAHLRRAGRRTAARTALATAMDLAHACAATSLVEHARAELMLAGARPRRDAITGRDALTAAERRVVELAAAGATNRDIATELFITTKTVEGHLARSFRKLGVTRRTALGAALTGEGPA